MALKSREEKKYKKEANVSIHFLCEKYRRYYIIVKCPLSREKCDFFASFFVDNTIWYCFGDAPQLVVWPGSICFS